MTPTPRGPLHSGTVAPSRTLAGRYQLQATLGDGRYSTVYLAHDLHVGNRRVAVKVARPGRESADHLLQEARALASIEHPAVPRLVDVGRGKDTLSLVLEYLPGQTLSHLAATAPVAEGDALEWGLRLCDVLIHLHGKRQPLAHGAVNASHCMLLPTGRLVLFDFGAAAQPDDGAVPRDTQAVPRVLHQLLRGTSLSSDGSGGGTKNTSFISPETTQALLWALQPPVGAAPLTLGAFRRLLVECRHTLGLRSGICPYCQAVTRADARHCGACGSPMTREPSGESLPSLYPPPSTPASAHTVRQPSYQGRLRALGRAADRDGLHDITLREGTDGYLLRGHLVPVQAGAGASRPSGHKTQITVHMSHTDLDTLSSESRQLRHVTDQNDFRHITGPTAVSWVFPTGYEDGLRSLGYQLDCRGGIQDLIIAETEEGLSLEYTLVGDNPGVAATRHHLVLSTVDMEAVIAEAVDRRGGA